MTLGAHTLGTAALGAAASGGGGGGTPYTLTGTLASSITRTLVLGGVLASVVRSAPYTLGGTLASLVLGPQANAPASIWGASVVIDGVDWTARLVDGISVDAEEGGARVADLALLPQSGAVSVTAWVAATVEIDFLSLDTAGNVRNRARLFSGLVDTPSYDINTGVMRLRCADGLQDAAANLSRAALDALTPGALWHAAVADDAADGWQYLQDRMSTLPAAVDRAPSGQLRLTSWDAKAVPDLTFTDDAVIDGSVVPQLATRSGLRNEITVAFSYRFPRLKRRKISAGYGYPFSYEEIFTHGYGELTREAVRQAINGTGWKLKGEINFTPRRAGPFALNFGGTTTAMDVTTQEVADQLCRGYTAGLEKRYAQLIEEKNTLTVSAPRSVERLGRAAGSLTGSLEAKFDAAAWEKDLPDVPAGTDGTRSEPQPAPAPVVALTGETFVDYTATPGQARADASAAIAVLIARAQRDIRGAHRGHRVPARVICDPRLDIDKTVRVATARCTAKGKLARVVHKLDFATGSAVSEIELAISAIGVTGLPQVQSQAVAPAAPAAPAATGKHFVEGASTWVGGAIATPPTGAPATAHGFFTNVTAVTSNLYSNTAPRYENKYVLETPEIPAADRDNLTIPVTQTYEVSIPEDELTMSF